jgi:protein AbiQ
MNELQKIVYIDDAYISYLQKKYKNVYWNKQKLNLSNNEFTSRPYIGVILTINNVNFFAPLTSKDKSNNHGFFPIIHIQYRDRTLGYINLSKMIPVDEKFLININFQSNASDDSKTLGYKKLLFNQWRSITRNKNKILEEAKAMFESDKKYYLELMEYSSTYNKDNK